jgi:hypothetical protein
LVITLIECVDRWFEPRSGKSIDYVIGICWFSAKHTTLKKKSKEWLARNQNNVCESGGMDFRGLLFCELAQLRSTKRVGLVLNSPCHHFVDNQLVIAMI